MKTQYLLPNHKKMKQKVNLVRKTVISMNLMKKVILKRKNSVKREWIGRKWKESLRKKKKKKRNLMADKSDGFIPRITRDIYI